VPRRKPKFFARAFHSRWHAGAAHGEPEKAGKIAEERLGMSSLRLHCGAEVAKYMPQGMQDAGMEMHKAASRFASECP
jgi:hypothetical protein